MDKPRLLVVEDEETIRKQMKWALNEEYDVILAEHRAMAAERMRQEAPPLVLLDLGLPPAPRTAEEGLRCLKELLRIDPRAKVIVVTGNQAKENALKAIELGAFDYFLKPADFVEVKVVLERALNIFHLERENVARTGGETAAGFGELLGGFRGEAVRRHQLRGDSGEPAGERAVRSREGVIHRGGRAEEREDRIRGRRDPVP